MSENKADNRSGINQLPEECHREVHSGCLDPYSNELISSILKKNGSSKAHKRTHKSNRWNGDRKYHTERMAGSEINHAGSTCKSKFGYEEEVKNECDWSHYDQFMKGGRKNCVGHSTHIKSDVITDHGVYHEKYHDDCKNYFLKFVFWHKKILLEILMIQEHVLFVNHSGRMCVSN